MSSDVSGRRVGFAAAFSRHVRWQRNLLRDASDSGDLRQSVRFLILRPGDKLTVCHAKGMADVRANCFRAATPRTARPPGLHWDGFMVADRPHTTRPIPGLGNVALSLVAAAATAIVSQRVLLLENFSSPGASFDGVMRELLVETSGWAPHLLAASRDGGGPSDGFAAHDDFSAFDTLCGADLRIAPAARVWRLFSNQYFFPLLLLNPHHVKQVEALAEPLTPAARGGRATGREGGGAGVSRPQPSLWTPALRAMWRPAPRLAARIASFSQREGLDAAPYVAMHVRVNFADQRDGRRRLTGAVRCVRQRLAAVNASDVFVATMYKANRVALRAALGAHAIRVHWFGASVEAQGESSAAADSALADMTLMGTATEVLITPGSTFGYVAHGLGGARASTYGGTHTSRELVGPAAHDCSEIATSEPNFHFLKHALRTYASCRVGAREARARGSELYRRSAMQHR